MSARPGQKPANPKFTQNANFRREGVEVTAFEKAVAEFGLTPDKYVGSRRLKEWARRHKEHRYIPEELLMAWGMHVEARAAFGERKLPGESAMEV